MHNAEDKVSSGAKGSLTAAGGDSQGVAEFRVKGGARSLSPQAAEVLVPNGNIQLGPSDLTGGVDPS